MIKKNEKVDKNGLFQIRISFLNLCLKSTQSISFLKTFIILNC